MNALEQCINSINAKAKHLRPHGRVVLTLLEGQDAAATCASLEELQLCQ